MHMCMLSLSLVRLFATPLDCSLPGSSVHGIFQARILEWVSQHMTHYNLVLFHFLRWAFRICLLSTQTFPLLATESTVREWNVRRMKLHLHFNSRSGGITPPDNFQDKKMSADCIRKA